MKTADPSTSKTQVISLSPSPAALVESLRSIGYSIETALADIIDNSISAGAETISVRFLWNDGKPWVAILDDGCGMSADELRLAMRFGSQSPTLVRAKNDLGRFGLGLKTASISQCRRVTVGSKRNGTTSTCEWDLDYLSQAGAGEWMLKIINDDEVNGDSILAEISSDFFEELNSGTLVLWREMDAMLAGTERVDSERKFNELMNGAREHLETIFHRFLSPDPGQKAIRIDFNHGQLKAFNPFGPNVPARQELQTEEIRLGGNLIQVQPFVLPHRNKVPKDEYERYQGRGGYLNSQGFYVYRNRRLIVMATWFRIIRKEELTKLIRIRVDIPNSMDHLWGVNVMKSQITPPEVVRRQLKKIINRISDRGKNTAKRKTVRINEVTSKVWSREVSDGQISYRINYEHPAVDTVRRSLPPEDQDKLKTLLAVISDSFPKDMYYADVAGDDDRLKATISDEEDIRKIALELLKALFSTGLKGEELKDAFIRTEIPGANRELKESLLSELETPD